MSNDTVVPSNESRGIAANLVTEMQCDGLLGTNSQEQLEAVAARIAAAIEKSWRQGIDDAAAWHRVDQMLRDHQ